MTREVPLRLRPRLVGKPWGGTRLAGFGFGAPDGVEPWGEAHISHGCSGVVDSAGERSLAELVGVEPERFVGERGRQAAGGALFPLLIKLIDTAADLSIQIHPDDASARGAGEATGKTEAWHILAAEPGATVRVGLRSDADPAAFAAAVRAGDPALVAMLREIPVVPGDTILLPAGSVHAIGRGILTYEIQQPSDITYRLFDWGRVDAAGRSRQLHIEQGLAVLAPDVRPEPIAPVSLPADVGQRDLLAACRAFALERITLHVGEWISFNCEESPQVITCLGGAFRLAGQNRLLRLQAGESALIPAGEIAVMDPIAPGIVLRGWVPDLERDVIRPARAGGAGAAAIAALAGPLDHLHAAQSAG